MLRIYHHIWSGGGGLNIAAEQENRIFKNIQSEFTYHPNIVDNTQNECHTLLKMLDEIKQFDIEDCVLFLHTKGATKPDELYEKEWREYMELSIIDDYKTHIQILNSGFDTSGVLLNYKNTAPDFMKYWSGPFYPGNFWWAKVKIFDKMMVNLKTEWGMDIGRYASESKFFTFIHKWNPATFYPSFENFQIFYEYIVKENDINKDSLNRLKSFI
jgi:hypothetical protein